MPSKPAISSLPWREIMRPFWRMVEFDLREVLTLFSYTLSLGIVSSAVPFASQVLVNQAAFTGAAPPIIALALIVLGILLIGAFIRIFQIRVSSLIAKRTFVRSALKGTQSLLEHPSGAYEFDDREVGNRFFDVMTFQVSFSVLASEFLGVLTLNIIGIIILALYHPLFFAYSSLLILICLTIVCSFARRGLIRCYERSIEKYQVAYWISQVAENRSLLRQTKANRIVQERVDNLTAKYVRSYFDYLKILLGQSGALFFVQAFASAGFFGLGGWLVVHGQLNLGQLVAAEIILMSNITALTRFYYYLDSFYEGVVAAWKVSELSEIEGRSLPSGGALPQTKLSSLTIKSPLLSEPLTIKQGETILLRGPSRRTCSVLLRDLARSDRDDAAAITWDCQPPIDRQSTSDFMLYLARPAILQMSYAENLSLLSDEDTTEETLKTVSSLPLLRPNEIPNLDSMIEDDDMSISDRARIAATRVFLSRRPVVLIDVFFNLMEIEDQITFLTEFKRRFPDRILVVHALDNKLDSMANRVIELKG